MVSAVVSAQGIADLDVNPDDIMLRKPNPAEQKAAAEQKAREEAAAKAAAEKAAAEKKAREDEMAKMAADRAAAEQRAREAAAAKTAAEQKAREDAAALKRLREQLAAEQKAREQAQAEKADVEAKAAAAQKAADAALKKAVDEKAALAAQAAAERKAADAAIEKANAAKDEAEKRAQRIASADPDERPQPTKKLEAPDEPAVAPAQTDKPKKTAKKALTGRPAVITAERTDYDRKEGIILFDRNVYVDDEQYQMHADRVFLFFDVDKNSGSTNGVSRAKGTNDVSRAAGDVRREVAIGNVAMTNDAHRAYGAKATYSKKNGLVVLYSGDGITAEVRDESKAQPQIVRGKRIRFWIDSEQVEVDEADLTGAAPSGGAASLKKALGK